MFVCVLETLLFNSSQLSSSTSTVKSAKHANNSNGKNIFNQLTVKVYGNTSPRKERERKIDRDRGKQKNNSRENKISPNEVNRITNYICKAISGFSHGITD